MKRYEVVFKCDENKKTISIIVESFGICTALEEAIHKLINKNTKGLFYYPVKIEEIGEVDVCE